MRFLKLNSRAGKKMPSSLTLLPISCKKEKSRCFGSCFAKFFPTRKQKTKIPHPCPHPSPTKKKRKEKKECDQGWAEISGQRKGRFLYFLWTGHFKETHVWAGFHQTASFSSWFWLAPGPATALVRSCWKGGCVPRLSDIFRAWGGRIFFLCEGKDEDVIQSSGPVKKLKFGTVQEADREGNKARNLAARSQMLKTRLFWSSCKTEHRSFLRFSHFLPLFIINHQQPHTFVSTDLLKDLCFIVHSLSPLSIKKQSSKVKITEIPMT